MQIRKAGRGEDKIDRETEKAKVPPSGKKLLSWYDENKRILPWREDPSPYHVWLSEIMLQQTRVEAVKGYYERFLAALPDIAALASAPEDAYLKLWEGLGYYSRVRNLHKAAGVIMEEYGGRMPETVKELRTLPGVGPYTAAAIASIAFGAAEPALDGNLLRIFARMTACEESVAASSVKKKAEDYFRAVMQNAAHADRSGDINQALMDLGATVCLPNGAPQCESCPWAGNCAAHSLGRERSFPVTPEKKPRRIEELTVFVILAGSSTILHKRPERGLLAGLYEFPNAVGHLDRNEAEAFVRALGLRPLKLRPLPPAKHIFTHIEWHMTGYEVRADELELSDGAEKWHEEHKGYSITGLREAQEKYSIPSAFRAYYDHFRSLRQDDHSMVRLARRRRIPN